MARLCLLDFMWYDIIILDDDFNRGEDRMEPVCYTVRRIDGDVAILLSDSGVENTVAMALLPPETDEGMRLLWKDFEYFVL